MGDWRGEAVPCGPRQSAELRALAPETREVMAQALESGHARRVRPELCGSVVRITVRPSLWGREVTQPRDRGEGCGGRFAALGGLCLHICHLLEVLEGGSRGLESECGP